MSPVCKQPWIRQNYDNLLGAIEGKLGRNEQIEILQVIGLQAQLTTLVNDVTALESLIPTGYYHNVCLISSGAAPVDTNVITPVPWSKLQIAGNNIDLWDNTLQRFVCPKAGLWRVESSIVFNYCSC